MVDEHMPKEIISREPISLSEVVAIFKKREKVSELNYLQRIAQDHATQAGKISATKAKKIIKTLMKDFDLQERTAITIINFVPQTIDELRIFLQDESRVIPTEEAEKILALILE